MEYRQSAPEYKLRGKGENRMFKQAIVYFPKDEKILKQISKDIAVFHCAAAVKYMDTMTLDDKEKSKVINSLISDISSVQKLSA